jgi:hypothetical protein
MGKTSSVWQQAAGTFDRMSQPALDNDSTYEDVDACWVDMNNDGFTDLVVASGGNEFYGSSNYLLPRMYLNDGKGNLFKKSDAFSNVLVTASCVLAGDYNGDGIKDLFIGGRATSFAYGMVPRSYLLQNDGTGKFTDVTAARCVDMVNPGFVKGASQYDIDKDGDEDLVLAMEWDGIIAYINNKGSFTKKYLATEKGWWNFVLPCDIDNDGDIDFIAGNQGLNSRLQASAKEPVNFYYYDFDNNGKKEQLITYYLGGKELAFNNKAEVEKQLPSLKKKFLYAEDFAKASLNEIFGASKLKKADLFSANYFSNAVLMNDGKMNFTVQPLPWQVQLTSYRDAVVVNANGDNLPDILFVGNFYPNNIQMGRYDADKGSVLINKGNGQFSYEKLNGVTVKGEIRHVRQLKLAGNKVAFLLARNNDSLVVIQKR